MDELEEDAATLRKQLGFDKAAANSSSLEGTGASSAATTVVAGATAGGKRALSPGGEAEKAAKHAKQVCCRPIPNTRGGATHHHEAMAVCTHTDRAHVIWRALIPSPIPRQMDKIAGAAAARGGGSGGARVEERDLVMLLHKRGKMKLKEIITQFKAFT